MNRPLPTLLIAAACAMASVPAAADLALATAKNCMSCHHIDKKVVGPAYKDVADKYRGDKTAPARLASKVMEGGGGVWGQRRSAHTGDRAGCAGRAGGLHF